jgi:hypothetical protein
MLAMQGGTGKGVGHDTAGVRDTGGGRAASEPARSEANQAREQDSMSPGGGGGGEDPELPIRRWGSFMISKRAAMGIWLKLRVERRQGWGRARAAGGKHSQSQCNKL